ncbi:immunoglobulin I-set domain-containing protein [Wuchereria bancrofti]|uniref:Immunoglobulin I-set domain-containing protein n=1 Tax=Wuchereria bancrofti TaxID=6293 RepID=J9EEJ0_WUCBA|nr:immunoglobulin I-set domain-containing protein [Wuchereria bancrofti]
MRLSHVLALFCLSVLCFRGCSTTPCPEQCRCHSRESVLVMNCSHSMLERFVPFEAILNDSQSYDLAKPISNNYEFSLSEVVEVDISHSNLEDVPNFDGFYHLKRLNLGYNKIRSISDEALASLRYLEELNLSHNQISYISGIAFKSLLSLQKIDLGWNKLKTLSFSLHIPNLKELYLNDNSIEDILPELPLNFSSLKTLSLANNTISHLQSKSLMKCYKLENLNLAQNPLLKVPAQALRHVASTLVKLNLSSTHITTIRSDDFANLLVIQEIDLSNTKMAKIEEKSFRNLPKLLQLHLNDNQELKEIHHAAFRSLPSLLLLHLHNCNLSCLHDLSPQLLQSLQRLTLHGNPLLCNCNLTWLQHFRHTTVLDRQGIKCISNNKKCQDLHTSGKCAPRIVGLPAATTVMERQRLVLTCNAIGNPRPTVQWRDPTDTETPKGQFLIFEKINQNQSGTYHCLAYSEAGSARAKISVEVIPRLKLQVFSINSTVALVTWNGRLPVITSRLRVRFRDNSTEFVKDAEVDEEKITVRFFREIFADNVEICLLECETELICDYFDNRDKKQGSFMYLNLFIVLFCFLLCVYSLKSKLKQVDRTVKMMRMTINLDRDPVFYNSNALAIEILSRTEL